MRRVLITGAAGVVGSALAEHLSGEYELIGVDRRRTSAIPSKRRDLRRRRGLDGLMKGVDAVVDLAALARIDTSLDDVRRQNLVACTNVLDAARSAGVRRVILASSNHVTGLYEQDEPYASIVAGDVAALDPAGIRRITTRDPVRPDSPYALGKVFAEAAARYYAERFGLSAACLRIGTVNGEDRPLSQRACATFLTHADLARLVRCCLEAPDELRYGVYYGVSANTWRFWDLDNAATEIGYAPQDDAESWRAGLGRS